MSGLYNPTAPFLHRKCDECGFECSLDFRYSPHFKEGDEPVMSIQHREGDTHRVSTNYNHKVDISIADIEDMKEGLAKMSDERESG